MGNNRVFYACMRAGIAPNGSTSYTTIRGLQSIAMTTTFNLTQAFEIGQLAIYENIEGIPDVQATLEKVLDGTPPVYTLATQGGTSASLTGRSAAKCQLAIGIYDETDNSATGAASTAVVLSGLYVNSVSYAASVNDNGTESVTLVGNNKTWVGGTTITWADDPFASNDDAPPGDGGVSQRENVIFGSGGSTLPTEIPGINGSGKNIDSATGHGAHIQSITASTNLGREDAFELGTREEYYKYATFPTEVTTEFVILATSGDMISATAAGIYTETGTCANGYNLTNQTIYLKFCEGLQIDLGTKNKLASIGQRGGDAGGGNVEITYTYSNFNDFIVYHSGDPNYETEGWNPDE